MITCPAAAQLGWQSLLFSPLTGRIPRPTNHRLTGGNNVDDTVPISMCQQTTHGEGNLYNTQETTNKGVGLTHF